MTAATDISHGAWRDLEAALRSEGFSRANAGKAVFRFKSWLETAMANDTTPAGASAPLSVPAEPEQPPAASDTASAELRSLAERIRALAS